LAEFLLGEGYQVHGVRRRSSSFNTSRIDHLINDSRIWNHTFFLHYADLTDQSSIDNVLRTVEFDEIYNLAAQSHVGLSFEQPIYTTEVNALGTLRILNSIVQYSNLKKIRFYQASTSELFGLKKQTNNGVLNEDSKFEPQSPYATSKLFAFETTKLYRDNYDLFAVNGILFNHESERRGETFVTRKITRALTRIKVGLQTNLILGNLDAVRDWGHSKDFVRAMHLMMQHNTPEDLVVATGFAMSVREFVSNVASRLEMDLQWEGSGIDEFAIDLRTGQKIVKVDPGYFRPLEVDFLQGDSSRARKILGWIPEYTSEQLIDEMTAADLKRAEIERSAPGFFRT
jgi:GDPmannose 4,6-dehydratase